MKTRDEHETVVADGDVIQHVLFLLGLRVWFRAHKYREEFGAEGVTIAVDETPIGTFVELEGGEQAILVMTRALGRQPSDFIVDSYRRLFVARRDQYGVTGNDMIFAGE